ncbi:MAG: hypothetical protein HKM95_01990, partial [Inquilinus sp.]|nr:hypothetical protein [Inquilinus sp.]
MQGRLESRDRRLVYLLCLIAAFMLGGSWFGARQMERYMIQQQAEDEVFNWARFVEVRLQDINRILLYGRVAPEDQEIIALMAEAEHVLQYRFFNRAGFIVLSSNRAEVGQRDVNTYFSELVLNGETFVRLQENENEFIGLEPDRHGGAETSVSGTTLPIDLDLRPGSVIAQAYTPVMQDGRFNGAIEVHINVTQT